MNSKLDDRLKYIFSKFMGDAKIGSANTANSEVSVQADLDKLKTDQQNSAGRLRELGLFTTATKGVIQRSQLLDRVKDMME